MSAPMVMIHALWLYFAGFAGGMLAGYVIGYLWAQRQ